MGDATQISTASDAVIQTRNFTKKYGRFLALDEINLTIPQASVGLLGANGAGKSTLIRSLLGIIKPTSGDARVVGFDTKSQGIKVRELVGYMPEADALPMGTTAADFVGHMAEMSGLPPRQARQRAADVLQQVGLGEERYRLIKGFSTGMRQRVKLAQAIVHDPRLVFLDEPTAGMDPQGREEMLELVERIYTKMGISVVFSSHILEDIELVCDYVVILDHGRVLASQSLKHDNANLGEVVVQIDGSPAPYLQALQSQGAQAVQQEDHATGQDVIVVDVRDERTFDVIRDVAVDQQIVIRKLRSKSRSLEDLYLGSVHEAGQEVERAS
ncbi:MAG: ABC transporter ATP-binding protein [Thermomicrobiales bacterium]|nr:ABC transporter ATP-binding protein [Thermomicrobiales bacterium]